jgi:predicted GTPase
MVMMQFDRHTMQEQNEILVRKRDLFALWLVNEKICTTIKDFENNYGQAFANILTSLESENFVKISKGKVSLTGKAEEALNFWETSSDYFYNKKEEQFDFNAEKSFYKELQVVMKSQKRPTVLVTGYIGVGKTTLIQKVLGADIVPPDKIGHGAPKTIKFESYQDDFITLIDSRGFEPSMNAPTYIKEAKSQILKQQSSEDINDHIHLVWYCISGPIARVTDVDLELIGKLFTPRNTLVILTKADITRPEQSKAMTERLLSAGVSRSAILSVADNDIESIKMLVQKSIEILPSAYKDAFIAKQKTILEGKKEKALEIVIATALRATIVGMLPVVDIPFLIAMEHRMLSRLAVTYGFNSNEVKRLIPQSAILTIGASVTGLVALDYFGPTGFLIGGAGAGLVTYGVGSLLNAYFISCSEAILAGQSVESVPLFSITKEQILKAGEGFQKGSSKSYE